MPDHYCTIEKSVEYRQKIERSEFLGIAIPVRSEEEFFAALALIQKRHFDATHHCWAFRLLTDSRTRSSDAGEPTGTAGRPILLAIESAALHDVAVVVVRWYGGIKLGTGGLSRAYRDTATETLRRTPAVDRFLYHRFSVVVPFDALSHAYRMVDPPAVILAEERFGESNEFLFDVRTSLSTAFERQLTERRFEFHRL